jgi:hypothetical protein
MWRYNREIDPPAPFLDIVVCYPDEPTLTVNILAKIDTAADVSAMPAVLVNQLKLPITRKLLIEGYEGVPAHVLTYGVVFEVARARFKGLRVVAFPDDYVLLGRDILNYFYIKLNGPDLTFDLSLRPF